MPGVSLKGDYGKLRGLIATLKDFVGIGPLTALSSALAEDALANVRKGFRAQSDPYGVPWKRSRGKRRKRGRTLQDTGRLLNSFARVRSTKKGFEIGSNVEYGAVHQNGATYTRNAGVLSRNARGRIVSYGKARKKRGGLRKGHMAASYGSHQVTIPQRMMVPTQARGLGTWADSFERTSKRIMSRLLKRKR